MFSMSPGKEVSTPITTTELMFFNIPTNFFEPTLLDKHILTTLAEQWTDDDQSNFKTYLGAVMESYQGRINQHDRLKMPNWENLIAYNQELHWMYKQICISKIGHLPVLKNVQELRRRTFDRCTHLSEEAREVFLVTFMLASYTLCLIPPTNSVSLVQARASQKDVYSILKKAGTVVKLVLCCGHVITMGNR